MYAEHFGDIISLSILPFTELSKSIVVSQKTISTNKKLEPLLKTAAFESSDEESDVELTNMESEAPIDRYVQSNMTKGSTLQVIIMYI